MHSQAYPCSTARAARLRLPVRALAALLLLTPKVSLAQDVQPVQVVDVTFATAPIQRNAALSLTFTDTTVRLSDIAVRSVAGTAFQERGAGGVLLRVAKIALLDVPLTHFGQMWNHEMGHAARAADVGVAADVSIEGTPWSPSPFSLGPFRVVDPSRVTTALGLAGGGVEAEFVQAQILWDRLYREERTSPEDCVSVMLGVIRNQIYMHQSLNRMTGDTTRDSQPSAGDPSNYVTEMAAEGWAVRDAAGLSAWGPTMGVPLKRGLWLNLVDFRLWGQSWNLVKYVVTGKQALDPHWLSLGRVSLMPFARYVLTPVGPETQIGTAYSAGGTHGDVSVRWTQQPETPSIRWTQPPETFPPGRLVGIGLSWGIRTAHLIQPRLVVDLWRDAQQQTGTRIEGEVARRGWPSSRASLQVSLGAKTAGYVLGLPNDAGMYGQVGLRTRF